LRIDQGRGFLTAKTFRNLRKTDKISMEIRDLAFPQFVELYARRAREFSDAVADLGRHRDVAELVKLVDETKRRLGLCIEAAERLEQFIGRSNPFAKAHNAE
jgi:hypothetical protein